MSKRRGNSIDPRWIRTPADKIAARSGHTFDLGAAERVRQFFRLLRHTVGRFDGKPFELLDWQWLDAIAPVFGWKQADGLRRFRTAYIEIPKKNGKSTLCGGLALYGVCGDQEPRAEVYCGAVDKAQASIVFNEADNLRKSAPVLANRLEAIPSQKRMVDAATGSFLQAMSADVASKEGLNASMVIFDELHAHPNRALFDTLRYSGAARSQPLMIIITTAGWDRASICWEQHEYATRVLAGDVEDLSYFAYIRAAGDKDDWTSPATWRKANPSLGATLRESDMAASCAEAQQSNALENAFKRYRLNIWTEQVVRWLKMDRWRASQGEHDPRAWRTQALQRLAGRECVAGLDLGSTGDLTALSAVFGDRKSGYESLTWYWAPRLGLWRHNGTYKALYESWERQGFIEFTDGDVTDYGVVRKRINAIGERFGVRELAIDRSFQGAQLATDLASDGFEIVPFGQGFYSMGAPTKEYEEIVLAGKITHGNNPVQSWMAANASVKSDEAGNLKVCKPAHNSPLKVDGIVTDIMAIGRIMATPAKAESIYTRRAKARRAAADGQDAAVDEDPPTRPTHQMAGRRMSIYSRRAAEKAARRQQQ